ncbi:MAG: hypothetical protein IK111_05565 [Lachnospiraceae bacterium]|nr:hypothetical protein [Lachnospiraceae bacterium]
MIKSIFEDFDATLRSKSAYIYFAAVVVLCIIANIAVVAFRSVYGTNEGTYAYNIMEYAAWSFIVPYLSCIFIAHMVFGKKYPRLGKHGRTKTYVSKLLSGILLAFVYLVITFVMLVITTSLFQMHDKSLSSEAIRTFCTKMFLAMPLFLAGMAFATMFLFCFKDKRKAYAGFFLLTLVIPRIILRLAKEPPGIQVFKFLRRYTISQCFTLIPYPSSPERSVPLIIGLGFIYTAVSTAVGIVVFNKKERTNHSKGQVVDDTDIGRLS